MSQSQHAGKKSPDQTTDDRYAEWTDLRKFERDCLVAIAVHNEDTPYGLAIKAELETWYREELNHGRLYPNLNDLVRRGLVSKSEIDKRTNDYALTDRGREVLQAGAGRLRDAVGGCVNVTDDDEDAGPNRPPDFRDPDKVGNAFRTASTRDELDEYDLAAAAPHERNLSEIFDDPKPNVVGVCSDCARYYEPESYEFCPRCGEELQSVREGSV